MKLILRIDSEKFENLIFLRITPEFFYGMIILGFFLKCGESDRAKDKSKVQLWFGLVELAQDSEIQWWDIPFFRDLVL